MPQPVQKVPRPKPKAIPTPTNAMLAVLLAGLAMSLYAFHPILRPPDGLASYDDLPRRLLRLGHIAAVMLPLINIVVGPWVDRLAPRSGLLLIAGAVGLPLALWAESLVPALRPLHPSGLPALAFTAGTLILAAKAARQDLYRS